MSYDIESIYRAYYADVHRYVLLMQYNASAAEDIVQNTFVKAMLHLDEFRGDSHLKTWLLRIARNESIRYAQQQKPTVCMEQAAELVADVSVADICCSRTQAQLALRYIQSSPEPKKSLLALHLLGEMPFVEIAQILGKTDTWCRVTFLRAKNEIIKAMEEQA